MKTPWIKPENYSNQAEYEAACVNAVGRITPETRKLSGIKAGNKLRGRTKFTHEYLARIGEKVSLKLKGHIGLSTKAKLRWAEQRDKCMEAIKKTALSNTGKTKENCEGKRRQAEKISGEANCMHRPDVLAQFIGKTKDNCDWRARQAETIKATQAAYSSERKAEIAEKLSSSLSGEKNGMFGRTGEMSPVAKYTDAQRKQCDELFDAGVKRKQIAAQLNVNYQTIKAWLSKR